MFEIYVQPKKHVELNTHRFLQQIIINEKFYEICISVFDEPCA